MIRSGQISRATPQAGTGSQDPEGVCAFCGCGIVKVKGALIPEYWNAVNPQPGVTLPMECGKRPQPGMGPGAFDFHAPR